MRVLGGFAKATAAVTTKSNIADASARMIFRIFHLLGMFWMFCTVIVTHRRPGDATGLGPDSAGTA